MFTGTTIPQPPPADSNFTTSTTTLESTTKKKRASSNGYVSRVGFDTFGCDDTAEYAFTLQSKTPSWRRTKHTRTFLVGTDLNDYSAHALHYLMENLVEDGDEIVALRVVPLELRDSLSKTGIPSFQGQEQAARLDAKNIMNSIREKNPGKEINIVVECMVGNVKDTIQHMIAMYKPAMLVVGTRGRSPVKGFLLGSVSRYCLHHSPVPVVVVRPERKLNKSKNKTKGIFRRRSSGFLGDDFATGSGAAGAGQMPQQRWSIASGNGSGVSLSSGSQSNTSSTLGVLPPSSSLSSPAVAGTSSPSSSSFDGSPTSSTTKLGTSLPNSSSSAASSTSTLTSTASSPSMAKSKPPPEVLKMNKSWTVDSSLAGISKLGSIGRSGNGSSSSLLNPLSLVLSSNKDNSSSGNSSKENSGGGSGGGGFGFSKKKRHSHAG